MVVRWVTATAFIARGGEYGGCVMVEGVLVLTFFPIELTIVKEFILKLSDADDLNLDITFFLG